MKISSLLTGPLSILDLNESVLSLHLIPAGNGLNFTFPWVIWSKIVMCLIPVSELVFMELLKLCVNF